MNQTYYGMEFEVGTPRSDRSSRWILAVLRSDSISPRSNLCLRQDAPCNALGTYDNLTSSTAAVAFPGFYPNYSNGLLDGGKGIFVNDTVRFSNQCLDDFVFGSTDTYNLDVRLVQVNPVAGIMGLSAICFTGPKCDVYPTLAQQLSDRGILQTRAFSIYLGSDDQDTVGHLLLGGIDKAKRGGPVFTLPVDSPWQVEYSSFTLDHGGSTPNRTVFPYWSGKHNDMGHWCGQLGSAIRCVRRRRFGSGNSREY